MAADEKNYFDRLDIKKTVENAKGGSSILGPGDLFKSMWARRTKSINYIARLTEKEPKHKGSDDLKATK